MEPTKKQGAQFGNQNAKKLKTQTMWACRLPDEIINKIKIGAKKRGISQSKYITLLIEADCPKLF